MSILHKIGIGHLTAVEAVEVSQGDRGIYGMLLSIFACSELDAARFRRDLKAGWYLCAQLHKQHARPIYMLMPTALLDASAI